MRGAAESQSPRLAPPPGRGFLQAPGFARCLAAGSFVSPQPGRGPGASPGESAGPGAGLGGKAGVETRCPLFLQLLVASGTSWAADLSGVLVKKGFLRLFVVAVGYC